MRAAVIPSLVLLVVGPGCKKPPTDDEDLMFAKLVEFTDRMCACKESACAETIASQMAAWSSGVRREGESRPSLAFAERMTRLATRYSDCFTTVLALKPAVAVDAAVPQLLDDADPEPPEEALSPPLVTSPPFRVDELLRSATQWGLERRRAKLRSLSMSYVGADGLLDPDDGELELLFATDPPTPDEGRRIGARVRDQANAEAPQECFVLTFSAGNWDEQNADCTHARSLAPRCSVGAVFRRAIAKGIPAQALASVALDDGGPWIVSVDDEPRNIHLRKAVADDCRR